MSISISEINNHLSFTFSKNVPLILQSEASECGIACLAMITNYYGNDISLREFRQAMPASSEGAKLTDLMQYAQQIGLSCRALKADLNDIINLR